MLQTFARTFSLKKSLTVSGFTEKKSSSTVTHTLLAFAHAEGAGELNLVVKVVLFYKILELFDNLARALYVAGGADANGYFHLFHLFHE